MVGGCVTWMGGEDDLCADQYMKLTRFISKSLHGPINSNSIISKTTIFYEVCDEKQSLYS